MLVVETVAKVRRAYFLLKKPIKVICRELHLSRKVVRRVLRSEATEFHYERERQPLPRIGPWQERLDALLLANERKPSCERLTLVRVFEQLRRFGYVGSYDVVRRYARSWRTARRAVTAQAFVPLSFAPGEAYQFDWSHEIVTLGGVTSTVEVAHLRLCHSRMPFVRAYPREAQEMVFDAHARTHPVLRRSSPSNLSRNSPAFTAARSCANNGQISPFTPRSDDAHNARLASAAAPIIHDLRIMVIHGFRVRAAPQQKHHNCNARRSPQR